MERRGTVRRQSPLPWLSRAALAVASVTTMIVIYQAQTMVNSTQVVLVFLASGMYLAMLAADHRWGGLNIGLVAIGRCGHRHRGAEWARALHR